MEDDNGLDLTLSLPCGGPSTSLEGKTDGGLDTRVEKDDRGSKLIDDFKNFLDGGTHKEDSIVGSRKSDHLKPEGNLFYDLSKATTNADDNGGFWRNNDGKPTEVQEERRQEAGNKRKNSFDDINHQKRHDAISAHILKDEGSTAENEDVADSEVEGSTSKGVQHRDDASKRHTESLGLSEGAKEVRGVSGVDIQGQRRFIVSSEKEFKVGHMSYGVPFSGQSTNILNMPYPLSTTKEPNSSPVGGTATSGYNTLPSTNPVMAPTSSDRPGTQQPVVPANLPLMFGYSPGDQSNPPENPSIKPGIAAELKFGGSGSSPNLPWVSTTGAGPNGKTISGVTYRYSGTQIRIVCACHGSHMSPDEFVQHASEEKPDPNGGSGGGPGLASVPNGNPATSAQN